MITKLDWSGVRKQFAFPHQLPLVPNLVNRQGSMQPEEIQLVAALAEHIAPNIVCEFGTCEGYTARAILTRLACIKHYIGIDVPATYAAPEFVPENQAAIHVRAQFAMTDPRFAMLMAVGGTESLSLDVLPRNVAMCIIDADHRYKGVKRDTALARGIVRPSGILIWHDYAPEKPGVTQFLDEESAAGHQLFNLQTVVWEIVE